MFRVVHSVHSHVFKWLLREHTNIVTYYLGVSNWDSYRIIKGNYKIYTRLKFTWVYYAWQKRNSEDPTAASVFVAPSSVKKQKKKDFEYLRWLQIFQIISRISPNWRTWSRRSVSCWDKHLTNSCVDSNCDCKLLNSTCSPSPSSAASDLARSRGNHSRFRSCEST